MYLSKPFLSRPYALSCARRGFTLTEMAIVLLILGAMFSAIWVAVGKVNDRHKIIRAQKQIIGIVGAVRSLYAEYPVFKSSADASNLTNLGLFDKDMIVAGSTYPISPFNQSVNLYIYGGTNKFRVSYYSVTIEQCVQLAAAVLSSATGAETPVAVWTNLTAHTIASPYTVDAIRLGCSYNTTLAGSSLEFDYTLL